MTESNIKTSDNIPLEIASTQPIRKVLVFLIIALGLFMTTVDATIVATALDTLQEELHTTVNWVSWTLTAYSFGLVLMLPLSAKLSTHFGHRRIFLLSVSLFTIASLCCGLASNIYLLIALRVIQAFGGAGFTPAATGIIVEHFGNARDRAVSLFGSIFPAGAMVGPIFGGVFVTYFSWRDIFFVNIPFGIIVILASLKFIPKDKNLDNRHKIDMDYEGILLMAIGLLASMFAATYLGEKNSQVMSPLFIGLATTGIITIVLFFRHIKRRKNPFISPKFIYGKGFGAVNMINVIYGGCAIGMISLIPLYAINRYHINALNSGTLLVAEGIASVTFSAIISLLLRRTGYRRPLYIGAAFITLGIFLIALKPLLGITPYFWLAGAAFFVGLGNGTISPPSRNAGLQLEPDHSATIAAIRTLGMQIGSIISIAIASAFIAGSTVPAQTQSWIYLASAVLFICSMPLISRILEHKGSW